MKMGYPLVLLCLTAPLFADTTAAKANSTVGIWSISDMHRNHTLGNGTCHWSFLIDESEDPAEDRPVRCAFDVRAPNNTLSCERSPFKDIECSNGNTTFLVGGGWSDMGFVVLAVINHVEKAIAYFGYSDTELNGDKPIPEQRKLAMVLSSERERYFLGHGCPTRHPIQDNHDE